MANEPKQMEVNDRVYTYLCLLGHGKGGYSYLVSDGETRYVLKQIHHEPCDYYRFGDKFQSELDDHETLRKLGIRMPALHDYDVSRERLLKSFIDGETAESLVSRGEMTDALISQVRDMCALLYPAGLNIDYYPTNFIVSDGLVYYVDYECNKYMEKWDFEHWGMRYWMNER